MEDEVNQRVVSVAFNATRLTASVLARALARIIAEDRARSAHRAQVRAISAARPRHGKMTLRELNEQNAGAVSIEVNEGNVKSFDRVARKYGIDYAVKKDKTCEPPKYFIFFKARDQESMMSAFKEFVDLNIKRQNRKGFKEVIGKFKEIAKSMNKQFDKVKNRHQEQSL